MDQTNNNSGFLNDSDLRLSTSLCQWAGFELDGETQQTAVESSSSEDHSADSAMTSDHQKSEDKSTQSVSPKNDGEKADEVSKVVREFLLEKTSQFYNDIINAQGESLEKTGLSVDRLRERYETLRRQTASVLDRFRTTEIEEELNNRLKSIDAALRQLSIMKTPAAATLSLSSSDSGRSSTDELGLTNANPLHQWRQWVESIEAKMSRLRQRIDWSNREFLEQRLKLQQALQSQIEQEGGHCVAIVQKFIDSFPSSHRRQIFSESVKRRWHGLWIKSLEWQCRLERQIRALVMGITDSDKQDADLGEPLAKKRRLSEEAMVDPTDGDGDTFEEASAVATVDDLCSDDLCSAASDTIPFSENEYEPLTPRSVQTSHHEEEPNSARDGGYSSGSSAVVTRFDLDQADEEKPKLLDIIEKRKKSSTGSSPCLERRTRIENSPVKNFYQMTPSSPDDPPQDPIVVPGQRSKKSMPTRLSDDALYVYTQPFVVPPAELTDSLLVNVGDTMSETLDNSNNENNADDLEEILNLFRQGQERDTFEWELEELLLRRRGTVWVPLAHDEEGEDDRRGDRTPTAIVDTPPNTPSLIPPTLNLPRIASSGSLKRRRRDESRRTVSNSFTAPCNLNSADQRYSKSTTVHDESADNLSSSWPPTTPSPMVEERNPEQSSLLNKSRSGRKKLRACRLRRSWSYGVQLENGGEQVRRRFTAAMMERCGQSPMASPSRPNTAVSNIDYDNRDLSSSAGDGACGGSDHSLGDGSGFMTGGGETMAEHDGDGEEVVLSGVLRGNRPVWEWDDYKPPNHNEHGPVDSPPLDDSMFTAFGDDYCTYLDQESSPRTPDAQSVEGSVPSSPFSLSTRLPPIGISYDSETDETYHVIRESQQELRSTHQAVKECQKRGVSSIAGRDCIDFLSSCECNIHRLEILLGNAVPGTKAAAKDMDPSVADLLQDWRDLALLLTRHMLESSPPPPASITGRSRSSEEEEQFVHTLQRELQRLTLSLQSIMAQGATRSTSVGVATKGNAYRSLEETQEIVDLLKAVQRSLTAEKIRLDCIWKKYDTSVDVLSTRCEAIGEEVAQLRSYFEQAYENCDSQLRELERLRQQWLQWQQTEELCRHIMTKLGSEMSRFDYKTLKSELMYLDERVSRVEIAFTKLLAFLPSASASVSSSTAACIDNAILADLRERTESLRRDLDLLKARATSEKEPPIGNVAESKTAKVSRRKRSYTSTTEDAHDTGERTKTPQPPQERRRATSLRRLLFRYWPIQVCLCVLVCLNIFIFYPSCCEHMNRYWWSFGTKLDYSNGPPPS